MAPDAKRGGSPGYPEKMCRVLGKKETGPNAGKKLPGIVRAGKSGATKIKNRPGDLWGGKARQVSEREGLSSTVFRCIKGCWVVEGGGKCEEKKRSVQSSGRPGGSRTKKELLGRSEGEYQRGNDS